MAQIVNLNRARKASARNERSRTADANAIKHGRTKAERVAEAARSLTAQKMLDQHKLEEE